ncbi:DNA repair protein RecN [Candidatus Kinetoplastibacterium sorsogonicusi]|uniref:DNA repair protein RecN n=1 Tax=Candidatus Kinetoplastidibacterium kentomonadis TaxID=1576550 RepID=A0A3Q8ETV8_9PROT|nr:DNA repair protein RecN [Candidatus Kinetoplastibacterium sorsogonicusi]AWD32618.1 DNA repair protein RecN [Candidatus Kinetoplastibacterium sorsogonicusi]
MLKILKIKNFVTIDSIEINFSNGLTILSGETGAGKSIIVDAISLIAGNKIKKNFVKFNYDKAEITAIFEKNILIEKFLQNKNIQSNNTIIKIKRIIYSNGKSRVYIDDMIYPLALLKELGSLLVIIHSQNSYLSIDDQVTKLDIIDSYCNNLPLREKVINLWYQIKYLKEHLIKLEKKNRLLESRYSQIYEEFQKLKDLNLQKNEIDFLNKIYKKFSNIEIVSSLINKIFNDLDSDKDSIISKINNISNNIKSLNKYEDNLENIIKEIETIKISISEIISYFNKYISNIDSNKYDIKYIKDRLNLINKFATLYNVIPDKLYDYYQNIQQEIKNFNKLEDISNVINEIKILETELTESLNILSQNRKYAAKNLSNDISKIMNLLSMKNSTFQIDINEIDHFRYGFDSIEFLVNTNVGMDLIPISKVVSGGEMSRIFLAISFVVGKIQKADFIIFDEIDNGVSGAIAEKIGKILHKLGENSQILCITHLPQVAIYSNEHFLVEKFIDNSQKTISIIKKLNFLEKKEEIARMLGGIEITDTARAHAQSMLNKISRKKNKSI